jgi:formimidoylglutamate deiminase
MPSDRKSKPASSRNEPPPAAVAAPPSVHAGTGETGWLPDCVYTGEKFETGLAFFADAQGKITRFSREEADLGMARRLPGQAALPGLVNAHSHAFHRVLRGRTEQRARSDGASPWTAGVNRAAARLSGEDVFDTARMVFLEMLLSGVTCVGEFHYLHHQPDGAAWPDVNLLAREVIRAAHEVGLRIALLNVAWLRDGAKDTPSPARFRFANAEEFLRHTEALRLALVGNYPDDEVWLGVSPYSLSAVTLDQFKAIANYAHSKRMRLHAHVSLRPEDNAACVSEHGRTPVTLLAEQGLIDKRFTAIDANQITADEARLLGTARAVVCSCPGSEQNLALGPAPIDQLLAAGAGVALGTDSQFQVDLLKEARSLEYQLRAARGQRSVVGADPAPALFHAATVGGARSLGATTGAIEVGRPADFFTVNLFDPAIAGSDPESLMANIVFALERRAIRDVWVGARQRLANGRHQAHGAIVGRFVEVQRRLWTGA